MPLPLTVLERPSQRELLWEHCRNGLAIARLLVQERRPDAFVATTCRMAMESACRAALGQAGVRFDGDVERALQSLSAPPGLGDAPEGATAAERLAAAERVVAWVAAYLRSEVPGRSWGY